MKPTKLIVLLLLFGEDNLPQHLIDCDSSFSMLKVKKIHNDIKKLKDIMEIRVLIEKKTSSS